jgi:hypothetical protein
MNLKNILEMQGKAPNTCMVKSGHLNFHGGDLLGTRPR